MNLFNDTGIDTNEALTIYNQADKKAEGKAKKSGKTYGGDEVANEIDEFIFPILMQKNLLDEQEYLEIHNSIVHWDPQNLDTKVEGTCALMQQCLIHALENCKQIKLIVNDITKALKDNNLELFINHLFTLQKYLDDTLLKGKKMKPNEIQEYMATLCSKGFTNDIPNEKTFLAVQEMLAEMKYSLAEDKEGREFENLIRIENAFQTYYDLLGRRGISPNANLYVNDDEYLVFIETHQNKIAQYIEKAEINYLESILESYKDEDKENIKQHIEKSKAMGIPPAEAKKIIQKVYPREKPGEITREFCRYQIEHAREIFNAKFSIRVNVEQEKMLEKYPTYKDFLNKEADKEDVVYEEHSENIASLEQYKKEIVPKEARKTVQLDLAKNFLVNIEENILKTQWNLGPFGGVSIKNNEGQLINKVPKNMGKILDIIQDAKKEDPKGEKREVWVEAFNKIAFAGAKAAHKTSLFRDEKSQDYYNTFVKAYQGIIDEKKAEDQDEGDRPNII